MKLSVIVIAGALALSACAKDKDDPQSSAGGGLRLDNCGAAVTLYEGAVLDNTCTASDGSRCQNFNQEVATNVDPINHPYDKPEVYGCKVDGTCTLAPGATYAVGSNTVTLINWWFYKTQSEIVNGNLIEPLWVGYKIVATQCR